MEMSVLSVGVVSLTSIWHSLAAFKASWEAAWWTWGTGRSAAAVSEVTAAKLSPPLQALMKRCLSFFFEPLHFPDFPFFFSLILNLPYAVSLLLFSYLSVFPFLALILLAVFHPPSLPFILFSPRLLFLTPFNISSMSLSLHPSLSVLRSPCLSLRLHYILSAWTLKLTILARPLLQHVHDNIQFNKVAMNFCSVLCAGACVAVQQVLQTTMLMLMFFDTPPLRLRFGHVQQLKLLS